MTRLLLIGATALAACAEPEPACASSARELPSVALEECDGTPRDLNELNESHVGWLLFYSGS